jgi:tetratricopeptide (TPR) repeat protein
VSGGRRRLGRTDEALREARRAVYVAPMSARFESGIGQVLLYSGRYDEALGSATRSLALDPSYLGSYYLRGHAYTLQGDHEKALASWNDCVAHGCDVLPELGYRHAMMGRRDQALRIVDSLKGRWRAAEGRGYRDHHAIGIATVLTALGDHEQALDWLDRGATRGTWILYLAVNPYLRPLHGEPRFQALLRRVGLAR